MNKFFLTLSLLTFLLSCSPPEEPVKKIGTLRVGVLPDESIESLNKRHRSLINYLSKQLDIPVELVVPKDYNELISLIGNSDIELGYFGGVTFVQANEKYGIAPIVMRDIDKDFSSYFIAGQHSTGSKLENFKNTRLSFGNRLSTSGHFMTLSFLKQKGINPLVYFSEVQFSGSHYVSVYNVRDGKADLVAVNSKVVKSMIQDGRVSENELRLIWETPPYADYVWAVRNGLGNDFKQKITNAFLSLTPVNSDHFKILKDQRAGGFLPASEIDFIELSRTMKEGRLN